MSSPTLALETPSGTCVLRVAGRLVTETLDTFEPQVKGLAPPDNNVAIDLSGLEALDTGGAWVLADMVRQFEAQGRSVSLVRADDVQMRLIATVQENLPKEQGVEAPPQGFRPWLEGIGETVVSGTRGIRSFFEFFGLTLHRLARTIVQPWRLRVP